MVTTIVSSKKRKSEKIDNSQPSNGDKVLSCLKKELLLTSFSKIYLQHLSSRYLEQQDPKVLASFLETRYQFFKDTLDQGQSFESCFHFSSVKYGKDKRCVLEFVSPDSSHMLITIQAIFKE